MNKAEMIAELEGWIKDEEKSWHSSPFTISQCQEWIASIGRLQEPEEDHESQFIAAWNRGEVRRA